MSREEYEAALERVLRANGTGPPSDQASRRLFFDGAYAAAQAEERRAWWLVLLWRNTVGRLIR